MAAYASTVTIDTNRAEKMLGGRLALVTGQCDLTNYNTTGAEITDITKYFTTILRVVSEGVSGNGYLPRWNTTDKCFHAYAAEGTDSQPMLECADDDDVGGINFIAVGIV